MAISSTPLSLYHLLDPEVLADPYPLYERLRTEDRVHWDPYPHAWVVTRYDDVVEAPIASLIVKQILFLDPPEHTRVRHLAAAAFTPRRVARLRDRIREIAEELVDRLAGERDGAARRSGQSPAGNRHRRMFGVPLEDHRKLKGWSQDFAEMLGNFQHNPDRSTAVLRSVEAMTTYFHDAVRGQAAEPREGLIHALATAEVDGDRLTEEEVVANVIVTTVGGMETTTNLIGNGLLTLFRHPEEMTKLREDLSLMPSAIEGLLGFESPSQHTARLAPDDVELGGTRIKRHQAVIAVMGAANRDPARFSDPDRLDLTRPDNRHLAFAWASHFCFGAPLARIEGEVALTTLLARFPDLRQKPGPVHWRPNLGLRGLTALHVKVAP